LVVTGFGWAVVAIVSMLIVLPAIAVLMLGKAEPATV
jgi:hypothetical protein